MIICRSRDKIMVRKQDFIQDKTFRANGSELQVGRSAKENIGVALTQSIHA